MRRRLFAVAALAGVGLALVGWPTEAMAHPLGNFTVNVYSGLRVQSQEVDIDVVVDMAEVPTFQTRRDVDTDGDGTVGTAESEAYARQACAVASRSLQLTTGGRSAALRVGHSEITFPPGQADLPTLRLTCSVSAAIEPLDGEQTLTFANVYHADRVGWREITAVGDGTTLTGSDVPATSVSRALTSYPDDLLQSPLDQRRATLQVRPGGPALRPEESGTPRVIAALPRAIDDISRSFTDLVSRQHLTPAFGLLAFGVAIILGGVHALAPGHGKTVMAAYVVGQRGSWRQAAAIGLTVTATHTAGVLLLGGAISASTGLVPERIYPWLSVASGALLAGIGVSMLRQRRRSGRVHHHVHAHAHGHAYSHGHDHLQSHGHDHLQSHGHAHAEEHVHQSPSRRELLTMGLAGGMVPTPSALVVLLAAVALGRAWFGVVLVAAYGIGMALTLVAIGLLLARGRSRLERRLATAPSSRLSWLMGAVPVLAAALIVAVGVVVASRGIAQV